MSRLNYAVSNATRIASLKSFQHNEGYLSHDVASGSDIMLCNKINKPLVVYGLIDIT